MSAERVQPAANRPAAHVTGWGRYAPSQVLTNADLERMVDTSDEWIVSRTGIRERRVAAAHETTASMAAVAGLRAIRTAGIEPDEIDLILLATLTPDYWMPSTAALVKEAIGNTRAAAMDAVVSWAAATRRSRMPVRDTIHSSLVSTIRSRSLLVRTWAGA